jgi:plastocyanin
MRVLTHHPLRSLALAALLAGLAVLAVPAFAAHRTTRTVKVGDYFFVRNTNGTPTVRVARNTLMRWHFVGMVDHNVTVIKGPAKFHSRDMDSGFYRHRVTKPGTYLLECTIHGFRMRLVVSRRA